MKTAVSEIVNVRSLRDSMLDLRVRGERQKEQLSVTLGEFKDSLRPVNLARQALQTLKSAGKDNQAMKVVFGTGGSVLAKRLLLGEPKGFFGQLWSTGIRFFLTQALSKRFKDGEQRDAGKGDHSHPQILLGKTGVRFDPPVHFLS